jgi:hypothetical protein
MRSSLNAKVKKRLSIAALLNWVRSSLNAKSQKAAIHGRTFQDFYSAE